MRDGAVRSGGGRSGPVLRGDWSGAAGGLVVAPTGATFGVPFFATEGPGGETADALACVDGRHAPVQRAAVELAREVYVGAQLVPLTVRCSMRAAKPFDFEISTR